MRLLKLHGSIDWWWVPGDISGMSLAREGTYGTIGAPQRLAEELRDQHLPGRERFIIPPLATKSAYYRNPLTRQLWREAYEAISQAPRLTLIGYSLPTTDFVIAGMIRSGLAEREVRLEVVDKYPDDPIGRLKSLTTLDNARRIARYGNRVSLRPPRGTPPSAATNWPKWSQVPWHWTPWSMVTRRLCSFTGRRKEA
jgi:hypothetical protein